MTDNAEIVEIEPFVPKTLYGMKVMHYGQHSQTVVINSNDQSVTIPAGTPRWRVRAMPRDSDEFIEQLQSGIPQSWESSEGSAESICVEYVREIERRLIARGGTLERSEEA